MSLDSSVYARSALSMALGLALLVTATGEAGATDRTDGYLPSPSSGKITHSGRYVLQGSPDDGYEVLAKGVAVKVEKGGGARAIYSDMPDTVATVEAGAKLHHVTMGGRSNGPQTSVLMINGSAANHVVSTGEVRTYNTDTHISYTDFTNPNATEQDLIANAMHVAGSTLTLDHVTSHGGHVGVSMLNGMTGRTAETSRAFLSIQNSTIESGRFGVVVGKTASLNGAPGVLVDHSTLTADDSALSSTNNDVVIRRSTLRATDGHSRASQRDADLIGNPQFDMRELLLGGRGAAALGFVAQQINKGESPGHSSFSLVVGDHSILSGQGKDDSVGLYLAGYDGVKAYATVTGDSTVTGAGSGIMMGRSVDWTYRYYDKGMGRTTTPKPGQSQLVITHATVQGRNEAILVAGGQEATVVLGPEARLSAKSNVLVRTKGDRTRSDTVVDDVVLTGDMVAESGARARVQLMNGARLTGDLVRADAVDLRSRSTWVLSHPNQVGVIDGDASSLVVLPFASSQDRRAAGELTARELHGQTGFALGVDLQRGVGDHLTVTGPVAGTHALYVVNLAEGKGGSGKPLEIVRATTGAGAGAFTLDGGTVDAGAYKYGLVQKGSSWQLAKTTQVTPYAETVVSMFSVAPTVWYGEVAPLRTRMGDLRSRADTGGLWARVYTSREHVNARAGVAYDQSQSGLAVGGDHAFVVRGGRIDAGLVLNVSTSHLRTPGVSPSSRIHSYSIGGYGSWYGDNGFYVDGLVKLNHFGNRIDTMNSLRRAVSGKYSNHGWGGQLEAGQHIHLGDRYYVEPYAMIAGFWASGKRFGLSNGLAANNHAAHSFEQSVGASLGASFVTTHGLWEPYVRLAAVHESAKNNTVTLNQDAFRTDLSGIRAEAAIGLVATVSARSSLFVDYSYAKGRKLRQPFAFSAGYRFRF